MKIKFLLLICLFAVFISCLRNELRHSWFRSSQGGWQEFKDYTLGFKLLYPAQARLSREGKLLRIDLPIEGKTNLRQEYILISVESINGRCKKKSFALPVIKKSEEVFINGINFRKTILEEGAAGSIYYVLQYDTCYNNKDIEIRCILRRINSGALDKKLKLIKPEKEMLLLERIVNTFKVLPQNNPCYAAEEFIESQPYSRPVLKTGNIWAESSYPSVRIVDRGFIIDRKHKEGPREVGGIPVEQVDSSYTYEWDFDKTA
ncbi:MAG: hypothetical protein B6D56_07805, partial [Candidatus Omnitrophica bacterium 4484_70.1]